MCVARRARSSDARGARRGARGRFSPPPPTATNDRLTTNDDDGDATRRFKRRDWNYMHARDGDSSSDSDSVESAGPEARSSDEEASASASDDDDDDDEEEEAATNEEATSTRERYDDARTMIEDALKGDSDAKSIAAKCRACPGTLLLSAANMRAHAASKRHRKNLEKLGRANDETFVCFYPAVREDDGIVSDGEAETHAERLARLRAQKILRSAEGERAKGGKFSLDQFDSSGDEASDDESDGDDDAKMTKRLAKKEFARKVSDSAPKEKEKRSRRHAQSKRKSGKSKPGKRQRMAMKSAT